MSQNTAIEWTDATWNPVRGCSRVSQGCVNCYAERQAARFSKAGPFNGFVTITNGHPAWTGKVELVEKHLTDPLRWKEPRRIFVNSMSDLFHEALPYDAKRRVIDVIRLADWHTHQILTKRPAVMLETMERYYDEHCDVIGPHPLAHLWLGVSVEDQKTADERIPLLLQTPAAVRFVSYEPALGPVDFLQYLGCRCPECGTHYVKSGWRDCDNLDHVCDGRPRKLLDWVIIGGESGPGARPMHPAWARSARDQCVAAGVKFFFKQWGEYAPVGPARSVQRVVCLVDGWSGPFATGALKEHAIAAHGSEISNPGWQNMYRVGKRAAGRVLDGREWNEFPDAR